MITNPPTSQIWGGKKKKKKKNLMGKPLQNFKIFLMSKKVDNYGFLLWTIMSYFL
jgi:hypothetical protein